MRAQAFMVFSKFFCEPPMQPPPIAPRRIALCGKLSMSAPRWSVMMMEIKHHPVPVVSPASFTPRNREGDFIVSESQKGGLSRRELMKKSGQVAAASALASVTLPQVHAGENNTVQVALVGCG